MTLSDGVKNFWVQLGSYMLVVGVLLVGVFWWLGWIWAIALLVLAIAYYAWFLAETKQRLLNALPNDWNGEITEISNLPWLDSAWLKAQTTELELLGFVKAQDYKIRDSQSAGRCFLHPRHRCYAEVSDIFLPDGQRFSRQAIITSLMTDNWSLTHLNRAPQTGSDSIPLLWRHPHDVGIYQPDVELLTLLQSHLQFRQEMVNDLGLDVRPPSWDEYLTQLNWTSTYRKRALKRANLLVRMIWVTQFEFTLPQICLGAYKRRSQS